ncbi:MAG: MFS transporter [Gammaproteobacteria bacterium]
MRLKTLEEQRKRIVLLVLGMSSGLPFGLLASSLILWMKYNNPSQLALSPFFLCTLPYCFKFLWAPWVETVKLPFSSWGQRRSWFLFTQAAMILTLYALSLSIYQGLSNLLVIGIAVLTAFFTATHDIVLDGYRIESYRDNPKQLILGTTLSSTGFKIGLYFSSAGTLYLVYLGYSWHLAFQMISSLLFLGPIALIFAEETQNRPCKKSEVFYFKDFFKIKHWYLLILFILTFKIADSIPAGLTHTLLVDLSRSLSEITHSTKTFGLPCMIFGGILGGIILNKYGIKKALLIAACIQIFAPFVCWILTQYPVTSNELMLVVAIQNFCCGVGSTALLTFLSAQCNNNYAASQFSTIYSFSSFSRISLCFFGSLTVDYAGWNNLFFFVFILSFSAIPVIYWITQKDT